MLRRDKESTSEGIIRVVMPRSDQIFRDVRSLADTHDENFNFSSENLAAIPTRTLIVFRGPRPARSR